MSNTVLANSWCSLLEDPAIREIGGENNNEGVDYARYWAMSFLTKLELENKPDYAILFEYLQDVAILDSCDAPKEATLYQLKKKSSGHWTRTGLCKADGEADSDPEDSQGGTPSASGDAKAEKKKSAAKLAAESPMGKLHLCVEKLSAIIATEGVFVSNAGYKLKLTSGSQLNQHTRVSLSELCKEDADYIRKKLCSDLKSSAANYFDRLSLEQTSIDPASMREAVRGLLGDFLEKQYPTLPNVAGRIQESLLHEFSSRSGPKGGIVSFSALVAQKGFTRSDFTKIVEKHSHTRPFTTILEEIISGLKLEEMKPKMADQLAREANRIQIRLVRDPQTKEALLWEDAVRAAHEYREEEYYKDWVQKVSKAIKDASTSWRSGPSTDRERDAVSLLAIIHVEQESKTLSAEPADQKL